ncbi:FtsX-like permease family protein [Candidatus Kryptobacter tengchongensis]|uniref:FtsX-like permease family protein n=1 Tax=Kryptobacter tengchongensis TaxID=1643429 RepID=UPI000707E0FD|nr:FtsX-like permease family protein [Candidatus Kryptobacter tengchongensis]CUS89285.1 lipoprotein-releasing system permease protein [Candidatus Kryptobacter tengchongensis]
MSFELFITKRYIKSTRITGFISLITLISIVGVMLGTSALIIAISISNGFERELKEKVIGFTSHIQVSKFDVRYFDKDDWQSFEKIKMIPNVNAVSPFAGREAMIRSKYGIEGVYLKGILPEYDFSIIKRSIIEGEYNFNESDGIPKIIIGKKLANKLGVELGDKVIILAIDPDNPYFSAPRIEQFKVSGIYETGMAEYDDIFVYVLLKHAQYLFDLGNKVSGFDVMVKNVDFINETAISIQDNLGYPYYARTMYQMYRNLFAWLELQKKPVPIVLGLIIIVAVFNIIGTLLMMVLEKMKEIGILKSMGVNSKGIMKIFVYQGMFIGIVGTTLGNILAYILCSIQLKYKPLSLPEDIYFMNSVPILLQFETFTIVSIASLILCFFATLIPSMIASRIQPVEAIRFA